MSPFRTMAMLPFAIAVTTAQATTSSQFPRSTFTAPGEFPTSLYSEYYNDPTATSAQVQPVITDPVTQQVYPFDLTNPDSIPLNNTVDPHPLPPVSSSDRLLAQAIAQIQSIAGNPVFSDSCSKCLAGLEVAKFIALAAPEQGPVLAVELCNHFGFSQTCEKQYSMAGTGIGAVITQVVANADVGGYDGQMLCQNFLNLCPLPPTTPLDLTGWFAKPKPDPLPEPRKPSGERLKVLHISDMHLDPRYSTGSEANCTSGLCCRANNVNQNSPETPLLPAARFGAYKCDSPLSLAVAALESIPALTGTQDNGFAWSMYTGDLVSHDNDNSISRDYIKYTETVLFDLFKRMLGSGPVYVALGNHDSYNEAQDAPHSIGQGLAEQFSWNYDHLASLWEHHEWLPESAVKQAKAHYSAFSVNRMDGLRIISLNTDMWYKSNYFNYINLTHPDTSGMLRFLTDELQAAEDAGERAWIIGHVLSGWDGSNPMLNPTDLFYQIVDRFTPHVIANVFFGHSHEDQLSIFYANNGTTMSSEEARTVAWMGPSFVPLGNINSGFRVYEVDSNTFDVIDAHTWYSDVSSYPSLDSKTEDGPAYGYEYSTRETYGKNITWGASDPLNATWWHKVTEEMERDHSLVTTFHHLQGKSSVMTRDCNEDCIKAKICYMRSGSASIAKQNCPSGYGSVQF